MLPDEGDSIQTYAAPAQEETLRRMAEAGRYNAWLLERGRGYLGPRVLDAGAGTGTFSELLADRADVVIASEPDPALASRLRARLAGRGNVRVLQWDATAEPGPQLRGQVDSIVCFNVVEHIRHDADALRNLRECLVPGGHLLLLVPAHPALSGSIDRAVHHERRYRKRDVQRLLEDAGYAVRAIRYVNPVGAVGWLVASRLLRQAGVPERSLRLYDRFVPLLRALDRLPLPFGLSVWAVARRPGEG